MADMRDIERTLQKREDAYLERMRKVDLLAAYFVSLVTGGLAAFSYSAACTEFFIGECIATVFHPTAFVMTYYVISLGVFSLLFSWLRQYRRRKHYFG